MRKEIPWTLEEKKEITKHTKGRKGETIEDTIEKIFRSDKNKSFSLSDIYKLLGEKRKGASVAITKLHKEKKIKIVQFLENGAKTISPSYQYKNGKDEAIRIIKHDSAQCKKLKLTSICDFLKNSSSLTFNSINVGKVKKTAEQHLETFYVKTNTTYARYYKKEDLEKLVSQKPKRNLKKKTNKQKVSKIKEEEPITFNLFGFKITISK